MYRGRGSFLISTFPVKDERKSQLYPELFQDTLSLPVHLSIKLSTVIIKKHFQSTYPLMSGNKNQESPFFLDWELAKCLRLATRFQVKNDKKETINSYA